MNENYAIGERVKYLVFGGYFTCSIVALDEFGVFINFKCKDTFVYFNEIEKL